jgi:hypothetical protein
VVIGDLQTRDFIGGRVFWDASVAGWKVEPARGEHADYAGCWVYDDVADRQGVVLAH